MSSVYHRNMIFIGSINKSNMSLLKDKWIADYLMSNSCSHCGESELICLQFYPDDRKIRALSKRSEDKTEVLEYISNKAAVSSVLAALTAIFEW